MLLWNYGENLLIAQRMTKEEGHQIRNEDKVKKIFSFKRNREKKLFLDKISWNSKWKAGVLTPRAWASLQQRLVKGSFWYISLETHLGYWDACKIILKGPSFSLLARLTLSFWRSYRYTKFCIIDEEVLIIGVLFGILNK